MSLLQCVPRRALALTCFAVLSGCQRGATLSIPPDMPAAPDAVRVVEPAHATTIAAARAQLQALRASRNYPALSVAVAVGNEMVWVDAWGWANLERKAAATTASRFPVASVSKPITATIVMRLAERGVLELDNDVRQYAPGFPEKAFRITSRQLLSHQAGIRHYRRNRRQPWLSEVFLDRVFPDLTSALGLFAGDKLEFEPDVGFLYSTFGYTLMGVAAEGATGTPFLDLLRDEVLTPSGMSATGPDSSRLAASRTSDYVATADRSQVRVARRTNSSYKWPGGGLLSTPTDLIRFAKALLGGNIVSEGARAEMFRPRRLRDGAENPMRYGLGWRSDTIRDPADSTRQLQVVYHGGSAVGAESALVLLPEAGVAVAMSGNASTGGDSAMVVAAIAVARRFIPRPDSMVARERRLVGNAGETISGHPPFLKPHGEYLSPDVWHATLRVADRVGHSAFWPNGALSRAPRRPR